jgi:hypothetical protein
VKIYFDTEFLEDGTTIRLISIGLIREDGKSLYRIVNDDQVLIDAWKHPWLKANVLSSLPISTEYQMADLDGTFQDILVWESHDPDFKYVKSREAIAEDVKRFVLDTPNPELWAYYSAYDHVALCQLYGRMLDLPTGFPMYTNDLKSEIVRLGSPRVPEQSEGLHNALSDAVWNKETSEYLERIGKAHRATQALQEIFDRGSRD